ncbi:MAG: hypothetical protein SFV51_00095 [Bryobacteraceae bacterium]|nr:hypothetical protein [Bryobacteraceae bacterium]
MKFYPQPFDYVIQVDGLAIPGGGVNPNRLPVGGGQMRSVELDGSAAFLARSIHSGLTAADAVIDSQKLLFSSWGELMSDYINLDSWNVTGFDLPQEIRLNPTDRIVQTVNVSTAGGMHTVIRGVKLWPEGSIYLGPERYREEEFIYSKTLENLAQFVGAGASLAPNIVMNVPVQTDDDADFVLQWASWYSQDGFAELRISLKDGWTRPLSNDYVDLQVALGRFENTGTDDFRTFANGIVYPAGKPILFDFYLWGPAEGGTVTANFSFGGVKRYRA